MVNILNLILLSNAISFLTTRPHTSYLVTESLFFVSSDVQSASCFFAIRTLSYPASAAYIHLVTIIVFRLENN
jgi:hypothetical protein